MADDPALNGPNAAAKQRPARVRIRTQKIKTDNKIVGGVLLGAIDDVQLKAADYDQSVDQGVARALRFTPRRMHSAAIRNIATQLRRDVLPNSGAYITARRGVVRQLAAQLRGQLPANATEMERLTAANGVLTERLTGVRLEQLAQLSRRQLLASETLQQFNTTVSTTFMKQSLALQYRQLYQGKDQITLMRAFADMVENKLDAIKINTKLPDASKSSGFFRGARDLLFKEAKTQIAKHVVTGGLAYARGTVAPDLADTLDATTHPSTGNVIPQVQQAVGRILNRVRQHPTGARVVGAAESYFANIAAKARQHPFVNQVKAKVSEFDQKHNISETYNPEQLWAKSQTPRAYMAALLRKVSTRATVPPSVAEQAAQAAEHVNTFSANIHNHAGGFTGEAAVHAQTLGDHAAQIGAQLGTGRALHTPAGMEALGQTITAFLQSFNQYKGQFAEHGQSVLKQFATLEAHLQKIAECACDCAGQHQTADVPPVATPTARALRPRLAMVGALHTPRPINTGHTLTGDRISPVPTTGLSRKDLHEEVAVRLDRLYDLLDHRLTASGEQTQPRSGSYQDHMQKLKATRARLLQQRMRKAGRGRGAAEAALLAELERGHGGGDGGEHDSGGIVSTLEDMAGSYIASKIGGRAFKAVKGAGGLLKRGVGSLLKKGIGASATKLGLGALAGGAAAKTAESLAGEAAVPAAESLAKAATGSAAKVASEEAVKEVAKVGLKDTLKVAGKTVLKRIPLVGVLAGGAFAANRAWHGDWFGAAGELASGLTSMVPGVGTAAGLAIDAGLAARDIKRRRDATAAKNTAEADKVSADARLTAPQTALIKARLAAYGTTAVKMGLILELENRLALAMQGGHPVEATDVMDYAHKFGFDVTDSKAVAYFRQWLAERAIPCYKAYRDVLENHQHQIVLSKDRSGPIQQVVPKIKPDEVTAMLQDYKSATTSVNKSAGTLQPDMAVFKKLDTATQQASVLAPASQASPQQMQQAARQTLPATPPPPPPPSVINAAYNVAPDASRATAANPLGLPAAQNTTPTTTGSSETTGPSRAPVSTPTAIPAPRVPAPMLQSAAVAAATNILQFRQPNATSARPASIASPTPGPRRGGMPPVGPSPIGSGEIIKTADLAALPSGAVGSGQCVALVQAAAGVGNTHTWNCGQKVLGNPNIKPGTPIAVFDADGKYGNHTNGTSHAAIYLGPSATKPGGIRVYDQWAGHPASVRDIGLSGSPVNNARYFSVIENAPAGIPQAAMPATQTSTSSPTATPSMPSAPSAATPSASGGAPPATVNPQSPASAATPATPGTATTGGSAVPAPIIDSGTANPYVGAAKTEQLVFHGRAQPPSTAGGVSPGSSLKPPNPTSVGGAGNGMLPLRQAPSRSTPPGPTTPHPTGHPYFALMYNSLYKAAVAQGCPNPSVVAQLGAAQTCLETGYGQHVPGNNAFGIKGTGPAGSTNTNTQEFVNGKMITEKQGFRKYGSVTESASDYIKFLQTNPRYKNVLAATTVQQAISAQAKTGYATDPAYGSKLAGIVSSPGNATALAATPGQAPVPGYKPPAGDTQLASTADTTAASGAATPAPGGGSAVTTPAGGSSTANAPDTASPTPATTPATPPIPNRSPIGAAAGYQPPTAPAAPDADVTPTPSGPTSNVVTPIQATTRQARQQRQQPPTPPPTSPEGSPAAEPVASPPHPDMMRMMEQQLLAIQQVAGHGASLNKQFGTYHRDFHRVNGGTQGPQGIVEQLTKGIQTAFAKQPQVTMPVVQQSIHHKPDGNDNPANDLDVRKKRDQRYAM